MMNFALVDVTGYIIRKEEFESPPILAQDKQLRWIPDNPPAYDPATQLTPIAVQPVIGDVVQYQPVQYKPITDLKLSAIKRVAESSERLISSIKAGYPESEVLSWSKQETEARAWLADNMVLVPLLTALATARGVTVADLAGRVIAKADLFAQVSGQIIGTRQAKEDAINALPDAATPEMTEAQIVAAIEAAAVWPV